MSNSVSRWECWLDESNHDVEKAMETVMSCSMLGASFHINPVSTRLQTSWTPHRLVRAADASAVRVSTAKKLEKCCVILGFGDHCRRRQNIHLQSQLLFISVWHQSQGKKQKRRSEDGDLTMFLLGPTARKPHPNLGAWMVRRLTCCKQRSLPASQTCRRYHTFGSQRKPYPELS